MIGPRGIEIGVAFWALIVTCLLGIPVPSRPQGRDQSKDLFAAVRSGDIEGVKALCRAGVPVGAQDQDGMTPLHYAAFAGRTAIVQVLVASGADVNSRDAIGLTPLHAAAYDGRADVAAFLINHGARLEAVDSGGMTPLHCAAAGGHLEVINLLLSKGASCAALDSKGRIPQVLAASQGHPAAARVLQEAAAQARIPSSAARKYTDDDMTRLRQTDSLLIPEGLLPAQCYVPRRDATAEQIQQYEQQIQDMRRQKRDLESQLPRLERTCREAQANQPQMTVTGATIDTSADSTMPGSYSRQDEWRRQRSYAAACTEYENARRTLEYYEEVEASYRGYLRAAIGGGSR